jgi:hypothetical protein
MKAPGFFPGFQAGRRGYSDGEDRQAVRRAKYLSVEHAQAGPHMSRIKHGDKFQKHTPGNLSF